MICYLCSRCEVDIATQIVGPSTEGDLGVWDPNLRIGPIRSERLPGISPGAALVPASEASTGNPAEGRYGISGLQGSCFLNFVN